VFLSVLVVHLVLIQAVQVLPFLTVQKVLMVLFLVL
jgi:hypothetical protein